MAQTPELTMPSGLCDAQGRVLNSVLERHSRDFTLLYLRHTIEDKSLEGQQPIDGHIIMDQGPALITDPEPISIIPTPEEVRTYGRKHAPKPACATLDITPHPEDLVEHRFMRNHALLINRGGLEETIDVQRQAMTLAAQHALDCAAKKDQGGFNIAQSDIEAVIGIGLQTIDPILKEAGMLREERVKFLQDLHEHALVGAIRNRMVSLNDVKAEQALYETYDEYTAQYQEAKPQTQVRDGALARSKHEPVRESDDPEKYRSNKPFTARAMLNNRDLTEGFAAAVTASNDNEEMSR